MNNIKVLGVDLAKDVFQLHGVDNAGKQILKKRIERDSLPEYIANLPECTIVMEACGESSFHFSKSMSTNFQS